MRRFLPVGGAMLGLFLVVVWWLFISDAAAPEDAPEPFDIANWRTLALSDLASAGAGDGTGDREGAAPEDGDGSAADPSDPMAAMASGLPTEIRWLEIGHDLAPSFAVQAGAFHGTVAMSYNAIQIVFPDRTIIIGGAVDAVTAEAMRQDADAAAFFPDNYSTLVFAMLEASAVAITHEHLDHIMAIARHPDPNALAPRLWLNQPQIDALPRFVTGPMPPLYRTLDPRLGGDVQALAPGVVVVPTPGHTAGSQMFFIMLADGREFLLVGDIVWAMSNIVDLTTRPVLTQFIVFDPNENREAVKRQLRGLHDLAEAEPDLIIVPSHDRDYINGLIANGDLISGFR